MTSVNQATIFYFTGTGNSGKVAEWITQLAEEINIPVKNINISDIKRREFLKEKSLPDPSSGHHYFFISPTHGFNYAPVMMHFIMRFPKGKNNVALINTRAGMRIGKFVTPGLSGIALLFSALILMFKGYSIRALFPVDLPSNWLSLHPAIRRKGLEIIHAKNKQRVEKFAHRYFSDKRVLKGLRDLIQDIIISPIAILYYFIGRFALAKTFYASSKCTNCGLCQKQCSVKAIKTIHGRRFWSYKCESCMHCMGNCPEKAIQTGHGYVTGLTLLYFLVFVDLFEIKNPFLELIINNSLYIIILFTGYRIIHWLLRFKLFSKLIEYTSLTHYKFWGKGYKALKDEEFEK